ncbi:hypothetical protein J3R83DRAFT_8003 [Lanmaoa asiatica]|nr:hypothetical protein J3R83DRAFT_8003 [Lanmaoa asiatica]
MSSLWPQDVYATNLLQRFGYPLRTPKASSRLGEPYDKEGFQIGDVGYVNDYGEFILLFNIGFPLPDFLREHGVPPYEPIRFQQSCIPLALPENHLITTGVERNISDSRVAYEFTATAKAGAILILPSGATLSETHNEQELEAFRKIAEKYALAWCGFAKRDSLYLVTGLHKTRSWTLGSFYKGFPGGEILVSHHTTGSEAYNWTSAFEMDFQPGPRNNKYENQTIFIKGFRMTVRWNSFRAIAAASLALPEALFVMSRRWLSLTTVEHSPRSSQVGTITQNTPVAKANPPHSRFILRIS